MMVYKKATTHANLPIFDSQSGFILGRVVRIFTLLGGKITHFKTGDA